MDTKTTSDQDRTIERIVIELEADRVSVGLVDGFAIARFESDGQLLETVTICSDGEYVLEMEEPRYVTPTPLSHNQVVMVCPEGADNDRSQWWEACIVAFGTGQTAKVRSTRPDASVSQLVAYDRIRIPVA